jgi:DHA2 family multidrug resistance protein
MMGTALAILSTSTVGVAAPRMQNTFSVSIDTLTWVLIVYNIAVIITASLSAWLGSLLGRKQVYILSLIIFTGASLWCGLSTSFEIMLVGRIVQGLGAGALAPIGNALVFAMFTGPDRAKVMGVFLMAPAAAAGLGPVLGGWLIDILDWSWVFFFTVPLAASLALLCARLLPGALQEKQTLARIDVGGIILLVLSLTTLQLFLLRGPRESWFESPFITTVSLIALISLLTFIVWEWRISEPVLNLRVLSNPFCMAGICFVLI